jgi:hypothetical protein
MDSCLPRLSRGRGKVVLDDTLADKGRGHMDWQCWLVGGCEGSLDLIQEVWLKVTGRIGRGNFGRVMQKSRW